MKRGKLLVFAAVALAALLAACTTTERVVARTVNDAARVACEAALGEDAEKQGLSVEELCAAHDVLQPFLEAILSAQKTAAPRAGLAPQGEPDGG